jgi:hypothetical protein
LFAAFVSAAPALAQGRYFAAIEDLPLAPGLTERAGGFVFQGQEGRIVSAAAEGPTDAAAVRAFYRETLPALGWAENPGAEPAEFLRGRERLILEISTAETGLRLEARLIARAAPD